MARNEFSRCHGLDSDECSGEQDCQWYKPVWTTGRGAGFCAHDEETTGRKITSLCRNLSTLDSEVLKGLVEDLGEYGVFTASQRQRFEQMPASQKCTMLSQGLLSHMFLRQFGNTPREVANRIEQLRGTWKQKLLGGRLVAEVKTVDQYRKDIDELLRLTRQELGVTKDSDALPGAIELVQKMTDPSGASIGKKWWFGGGVALGTAAFLYYVFGTEQGGQMLDSMKAAVGYGPSTPTTADIKPQPKNAGTGQSVLHKDPGQGFSEIDAAGNLIQAAAGWDLSAIALFLLKSLSGVTLTYLLSLVWRYQGVRNALEMLKMNPEIPWDDFNTALIGFQTAIGQAVTAAKNNLPTSLGSKVSTAIMGFGAGALSSITQKASVLWNTTKNHLSKLWPEWGRAQKANTQPTSPPPDPVTQQLATSADTAALLLKESEELTDKLESENPDVRRVEPLVKVAEKDLSPELASDVETKGWFRGLWDWVRGNSKKAKIEEKKEEKVKELTGWATTDVIWLVSIILVLLFGSVYLYTEATRGAGFVDPNDPKAQEAFAEYQRETLAKIPSTFLAKGKETQLEAMLGKPEFVPGTRGEALHSELGPSGALPLFVAGGVGVGGGVLGIASHLQDKFKKSRKKKPVDVSGFKGVNIPPHPKPNPTTSSSKKSLVDRFGRLPGEPASLSSAEISAL